MQGWALARARSTVAAWRERDLSWAYDVKNPLRLRILTYEAKTCPDMFFNTWNLHPARVGTI